MTKIGCFLFNRNALQNVEFLLLDDIHGCELNCSCVNAHNELVTLFLLCEADFGGGRGSSRVLPAGNVCELLVPREEEVHNEHEGVRGGGELRRERAASDHDLQPGESVHRVRVFAVPEREDGVRERDREPVGFDLCDDAHQNRVLLPREGSADEAAVAVRETPVSDRAGRGDSERNGRERRSQHPPNVWFFSQE